MAKIEIELEYVNGEKFSMTSQIDEDEVVTIVETQENGSIAHLWPYFASVCETYFKAKIAEIGEVMKA